MNGFRQLTAAILYQAIHDIKTDDFRVTARMKDRSMSWINSPDCETLCNFIDMDYEKIRDRAISLYQTIVEPPTVYEN
ncbi:hypothetical protein [Treponema primitia]|uniref:hypothetical protein n=1 Tax=Treponema primitia TaxID=88058 RepID=UPI0002555262|nr:hypothetical protein [Treponema primitia]